MKAVGDDDLVAAVQTKITALYSAKRPEFTERQIFRTTKRHPEELVNDYISRLRHLATHCKYDTTVDRQILDQFVAGCNMPEFQLQCQREDDVTLEKAVKWAQGHERAK